MKYQFIIWDFDGPLWDHDIPKGVEQDVSKLLWTQPDTGLLVPAKYRELDDKKKKRTSSCI